MKTIMMPLWIAWMALGHTTQAEDLRLGNMKANKILLLGDKTLVTWAAPADLQQRGGSVLTIDAGQGRFDGIIFGELASKKWMPGSEGFLRTLKEQGNWPDETADGKTNVQIAITYQDRQVTLYRNGRQYAQYSMEPPPLECGPQSTVLIGMRHLLQGDDTPFAGTIDDARIYDRALSAEQIAALKPNMASAIKPWAWWTFDDKEATERTGRFRAVKLAGGATVEDGKLVLDGKKATLLAKASIEDSLLHWRPKFGLFGDANPFFWKGEYHVFYLTPDKGLVWEHIVSKDLVHWRELPRALTVGFKGAPDEDNAGSGSVVEKDGTFHLFYVGFNSGHPNGRQQVMHATSQDLIQWTKHPEDTFAGDGVTYWSKLKSPPLQGDQDESFRDPYVWWNEKDQRWWMAVVAKDAKTQIYVLGRCISTDLVHWEQVAPFRNIRGDDCPDIFQSGGRWYCIRNISYYSSSESLLGPYQPDAVLRFDSEHLCVAKRMWDGRRHVGMGWVRDLVGNRDDGQIGWGGNQSIPREFFAGPEGLLCTRPVPEVTALFTRSLLDLASDRPQAAVEAGTWRREGTAWSLGTDRQGTEVANNASSRCLLDVPADYMLQASFQLDPGATLSVGFRQQPKSPTAGYRLTIRPGKQEIEIAGPRYVCPRRCPLDVSKPVQVQAFMDGSILECFVNDAYAFTLRCYDFPEGKLSLEVSNGQMRVLGLQVKAQALIHDPAPVSIPLGEHP